VYGRTKAAGEDAVRAACARHLILRVSWVYGRRGRNFLRTIQRLAVERAGTGEPLRVVHDQVGVPTWSRSVAEATAQVVAQVVGMADAEVPAGTYHLAGTGSCSWYEFACEIVRWMGEAAQGVVVQPITTRDYPTPAARPAYSVLDATKGHTVLGVALPAWPAQLAACLEPGAFPPAPPRAS